MREDTSQNAKWRKERFNQDVFLFDTVDARMTVSEDGEVKVQIGQSPFLTFSNWKDVSDKGDTYCIDAGQNWYLHDVRAKVHKITMELWNDQVSIAHGLFELIRIDLA